MDVFWQKASALSLCHEWPRLPGVCRNRCIILTGSQQIPPWETAVHVPQALGKEGVKSWDSLWFDPTCSETQGKMPKLEAQSFSQPPVPLVEQPRISPSRVFQAPGGSCPHYKSAGLSSWQGHLRPSGSESALLWAPAPEWAALMGLTGPGRQSPPPWGLLPSPSTLNLPEMLVSFWNIPQFTAYTLVSLFTFLLVISPAVGKDEILVSVSNPLCGHFRSSEVVRGKLSIYLCFNGYIKKLTYSNSFHFLFSYFFD